MRTIVPFLLTVFALSFFTPRTAHAQCSDEACIAVSRAVASVNSSDSAVLDGVFNSLLGTGTGVDLTLADHQALATANLELDDLLASLNTLGVGSTADTALTTAAPITTQINAVANTLRSTGQTAAADALDKLRTQASGVGNAQVKVGDLFTLDSRTLGQSGRQLNALDLVTAEAGQFNVAQNVTSGSATILGSQLGLDATISSVTLSTVVIEPAKYVCGPAGAQFYSASMRVRARVALTGASTPLTIPPLLSASLQLTGFDVVASVARASGTIQAVDDVLGTITVSATPGIAELYLGTISDANFFDRSTPIDPNTELSPGNIATLNMAVTVLSTSASVTAKGYAVGTPTTPAALNFTAPYPKTLTTAAGAVSATNLVDQLLQTLQVSVGTPAGTLGLGTNVLATLLSDALTTVTSALRSTNANGVIKKPLLGVLAGPIDNVLGALGIQIGKVTVRAEAPFAVLSGMVCNDLAYCTVNDVCDGSGVCAGTARDCGDGLACTTDACNETTDVCTHTLGATSCLIGGACVASGASDPGNACMACIPGSSQSAYVARPSGASCDDGLFCTQTDTCNGLGLCSGSARSCSDGLTCTVDTCNEASDVCLNTPAASCVINGACVAAASDSPTNSCLTCNPLVSTTTYSPKLAGVTCNDGQFCTTGDVCNGSGTCAGGARDCSDGLGCTNDGCSEVQGRCVYAVNSGCAVNGLCLPAGVDDPSNPCMTCNPALSTTAYSPKSSGTGCDDGQFCTTGDTCNGSGTCSGAARSCTDGLSCTTDSCSELLDLCVNTPSSGCAINGACVAAGATDPGNPCMACNPAVSTLVYTPKSSGTSCDDGLFCTQSDACNGLGVCLGAARTCSDGLNCTSDVCNEATDQCVNTPLLGCTINGTCVAPGSDDPSNTCNTCNPAVSTSAYTPKSAGSACDDGLFCTIGDVCNGASLCAGGARTCSDGLLCTADSCDEVNDQCTFNVSVGCSIGGSCFGLGALNPTNGCMICNPSLSTSAWSARPQGTSCDDGQFCTQTDSCNGVGLCTGTVRACDDGLTCTTDTCNELNDTCVSVRSDGCLIGGGCVQTGAPDPTNGCLSCNPGLSATAYSPKAAGSSCDDGVFCTDNDQCNGVGLCTGAPRTCDDGVACTTDTCNELGRSCVSSQANGCFIQGACVPAGAEDPASVCRACNPQVSVNAYTPKLAGTLCTDGLFCTENDACNGLGSCVGAARTCADGLACTSDTCNEVLDTCSNAVSTGCTIDGACVAEGAEDPNNPCRACLPNVATNHYSLKPVGASCSDGLYCTVNDQCSALGLCTGELRSCGNAGSGACASACDESRDACVTVSSACNIGGTCVAAGTADPQNPCMACDPLRSALDFSPVAQGTACSDGIFCTVNDVCNAGGLCTGALRSCDDGVSCTFDECDEDANRCVTDAEINDSCVIGSACVAAGAASPTNPCMVCVPSVSTTAYTPAPVGLLCDDGRFCTTGESCTAEGVCVGLARDCGGGSACASSCDEQNDLCRSDVAGCSIDGLCVSEGSVDPTNPCRVCLSAVNPLAYSLRSAGSACDDGQYCTTGDTCDSRGQCSGTQRVCGAGNGTCDQTCDEASDACVSGVASCSIGGACYATGASNPQNPCEVCDPARSSSTFSPRSAGTSCSDGLFCTQNDACNANGQCVGSARTCDDGLACTSDSCDEVGSRCKNEVTLGCAIGGACVPPGGSDPSAACRTCDPAVSTTTWTNAATSLACDDGQFCTTGDHCNGVGVCIGSPTTCGTAIGGCSNFCDETTDTCRTDIAGCAIDGTCVAGGADNPVDRCQTCDPARAPTAWSAKLAGSACDDGLFCTDGDVCTAGGVCAGLPRACSDGLSCTVGACNEVLGSCTQGVADGCAIDGVCMNAGAVDPTSPCRVCQPEQSRSQWSNVAPGTACSDGQYCTANDQCDSSGACVGGASPCLGDNLGCTFENCDEARDTCLYQVTTGCVIDGLCVAENTRRDADDACYFCDPGASRSSYSYHPAATGCDSDHDGLRDDTELDPNGDEIDTDGDGRPNQLDRDDDEDGIPTRDENSDNDGNALPDTARDLDEDGKPDYLDDDDDGDERKTATERADAMDVSDDVDEDGSPNWYDTDSDADEFDDIVENEGDGDDNDDGVPDYLQPDVSPRDDDFDGLTNTFECEGDLDNCPDSDGDGRVDYLDPDDDDDHVDTKYETRNRRTKDTDRDGIPDHLDVDDDDDDLPTRNEMPDPNGDGDPDDARDGDDDGVPDYLDPDSALRDDANGNGVPDSEEGNPIPDAGTSPDDDAGEVTSTPDAGDGETPDATTGGRRGGVSGSGLCSAQPGASDSGAFTWLALAVVLLVWRVRQVRRLSAAGLVALLFVLPTRARADVTLERFTPAALTTDGFALPQDLTFRHLRVGALLAIDYAHDPLVWEARLGDNSTVQEHLVRHALVAHAVASLDLWKHAALFVRLPVNLVMNGEQRGSLRADGAGLGNLQLGGRVRLFETEHRKFSLGAQVTLGMPTSRAGARHHQLSGEDTLTSQIDLIAASTLGRLRMSAMLGTYVRAPQKVETLSISTLLTLGVGLAFRMVERRENALDAIVELYGASTTKRLFRREETPLEVLVGAKWFTRYGLMFGAGVGGGLISGFGTPNYRLLGLVGYRPVEHAEEPPPDRDGDGIVDPVDRCPAEPEDRDGFEDADGCPDTDNDRDGILDTRDACPDVAEDRNGSQDEDGCPEDDDDRDGVRNGVDQCPDVAEDRDGFQDEDGCPEPDNDGDQLLDAVDGCPNEAEDRDGFEDEDGCPDRDDDRDGFPDAEDRCPRDPEVPDGVDDDGCPDVAKVDLEARRIEIMENILFETGKAVILQESLPVLNAVVGALRAHPEITTLRVEGHTDSRGNRQSNLTLSTERAMSVRTYLVGAGIAQERLVSVGFGDSRPIADNKTTEGRDKNRRVEFHIERVE